MRGSMRWLAILGLGVACGANTRSNGEVDGSGATNATGPLGTSGASATLLDEVCSTQCSEQIFSAFSSCKLCHSNALKLGELDLESPGRAARLKDTPAKHVQISVAGAQCPVGDLLIDSANVGESWILKKLNGTQGTCGDRMPAGSTLSPDQLSCMTAWVACVAEQ